MAKKFADIQQVVFILRIKLQCSLKILKRRLRVAYFEFGIAPKIVPGRRARERALRCAEQLHRLGVLPPFYVISR